MSDEPKVVFVYGTLQPGRARWPMVYPFTNGEPRSAEVRGRLFDTGRGYPAAIFDGETGGSSIPGYVVPIELQNLERALALLDQVEGTDFGLYTRVVVVTADGEKAWAYAWHGEPTGFEQIAAWDHG